MHIKGIDQIIIIKPEWIFCIQGTDSLNEILIKYSSSFARFFCESVPCNSIADAVIIVFNYKQVRFNIPIAVLRGILRKTRHEKLIVAGQVPETTINLESGDARIEVSTEYERHKLSKKDFFL